MIDDWRNRVLWYQRYTAHLLHERNIWRFLANVTAEIAAALAADTAHWPGWATLAAMAATFVVLVGISLFLQPSRDTRDGWGP